MLFNFRMKNLFKFLLGAYLILFLSVGNANGYRSSLGAGIQYGGVVGYQGSYTIHQTKLRFSLGYIGGVIGLEQLIGDHFGIGIQSGLVIAGFGTLAFANYYFTSNKSSSWNIGVETCISCQAILSDGATLRGGVAISLGYTF